MPAGRSKAKSKEGGRMAECVRAARCARPMLRSKAWPDGKPSPWLVPQFSPDAPPGLAY